MRNSSIISQIQNVKTSGINNQSISLFRIAIGIGLLTDLIFYKIPYFDLFFSVNAPVSNDILASVFPYYKYTFVNYLHSDILIWMVFLLTGFSAIALVLGFQTRIASIIAFICIYNLHERNMLFPIGGSDDMLRIIVFWSMFLPLDEYYIMYKKSVNKPLREVRSLALFALFLQIGFIYFFNALAKDGTTWKEGTAVQYALMIPYLRGPWANWLLTHPVLCNFFTLTMRGSSFLILFLIFSPFYKRWCRLFVVAFLFAFHWGVTPFLNVHHFCVSTFPIIALFFPIWIFKRNNIKELTANSIDKESLISKIKNAFVLFSVALIVFQNINNITDRFKHTDSFLQDNLFDYYGLKQRWDMFAPNPSMENGLLYTLGITPEGKPINLQTNRPFDQDQEYKRLISEPNLIPLPMVYLNYFTPKLPVETELGKNFWMRWTRYQFNLRQKKYPNTPLMAIWVVNLSVHSDAPNKYSPLHLKVIARGKL